LTGVFHSFEISGILNICPVFWLNSYAGTAIMFGDVPPGMKHIQGNDIPLIVQSRNADDITRWFNGMK